MAQNQVVFPDLGPRFNASGEAYLSLDGIPGIIDIRIFNRHPMISEAETLLKGPMNRVKDSNRSPADQQIIGSPIIFPDYWRFPNGTSGILTRLGQPNTATIFAVQRTIDVNIGQTSTDRAFIAGWFGGTLRRGAGLYWNNNTQIRGVDYEVGSTQTPVVNTADIAVASNDSKRWRVVVLDAGPANLITQDLTSGVTTSDVQNNGHAPGVLPFHIGYNPDASYTKGVDVAAVIVTNLSNMSVSLKNAVTTAINKQLQLGAIALGAE